jgi:hypothetical protein
LWVFSTIQSRHDQIACSDWERRSNHNSGAKKKYQCRWYSGDCRHRNHH